MDYAPRKVSRVIEPDYVMEGAGVLLRRAFGPKTDNHFDPFLLFDHFAFNDPIEGPIVGFPMHPHRGIETVTYMLAGNTRHRDSLGNSGVIGPGDVQWMTSGRGILHEEMPKRGPDGRVDGFQLWVNLPADQKMSKPRYQEVIASTIPAVEKDGKLVRVIAGEYEGVRGPVTEIAAKPLYMDVLLQPGIEFFLSVPAGNSAVAYLFDGEGVFGMDLEGGGEKVEAVRMVVFGDGDHVRIRAGENSEARFVLFAGSPFRESIVPYGPFVMNTREEILTALDELKNGTFIKE